MLIECERFLEHECGGKAFLVPSCTAALELSCMLTINAGDEVIIPSWSHPSAANAVILRGGVPVFIDVDKDLNIDINRIVPAITAKTKAIMPVHYAGVVAEMVSINAIAEQYGLYVIEDAAQAIGNWKVSGDLGCLSFQEKKNVQCGQGGALIVNNSHLIEQAGIYQNMGTNRISKPVWDWVDIGSSYLMSKYVAEYLHSELIRLSQITKSRQDKWDLYVKTFNADDMCRKKGNGHLFWLMVEDKWNWIQNHDNATSHFDALHMTVPGRKYGRVGGPIIRATKAMKMLVKLSTDGTTTRKTGEHRTGPQETLRVCV